MTRADLADRGFVVGARVGSERVRARYGTIVDVVGSDLIGIAWDDGSHEMTTWTAIAPLGYLAPATRQGRSAA